MKYLIKYLISLPRESGKSTRWEWSHYQEKVGDSYEELNFTTESEWEIYAKDSGLTTKNVWEIYISTADKKVGSWIQENIYYRRVGREFK